MPVVIKKIAPVFPGYEPIWRLRNDVLRKPLGMVFTREDVLKEADQIHLAAFSGDALLGCVLLVPANDEIRLRQMAVAETARGQGVGRELLIAAESRARKLGCKSISCHAREAAVGFYEANGWFVEGERFIEVTIPHFPMRKNL